MVVSQGAGLILTAVIVVAVGEPRPATRFLVYGAFGGLAAAIGLAALYKGLAVGRMSIVAPTVALSGAVPVIIGFLQGESPELLQLVGMAVAGVGVVLASASPGPAGARNGGSRRGIGYALIAVLGIGLLLTSLDAVGDHSPLWATLMIRLTSVPLFLIAAIMGAGGARRPTWAELGIMASIGVLDNSANVMFAFAAREGLLSLVAVLGSLYPVTTVLLARWFLHERLARWQLVGVAAVLAGVASIVAG